MGKTNPQGQHSLFILLDSIVQHLLASHEDVKQTRIGPAADAIIGANSERKDLAMGISKW